MLRGNSRCRALPNCVSCLILKMSMKQRKLNSFFKPIDKRPHAEVQSDSVNLKKRKVNNEQQSLTEDKRDVDHATPRNEDQNLKPQLVKLDKTDVDPVTSKNEGQNIKPQLVIKAKESTIFKHQKELTSCLAIDYDKIHEEILEMSKKFIILDPKIGPSWFNALKNEFKKPYFDKLNHFIREERKVAEIYPPASNVWTWTKECSLENIKVVILGQDPYHNPEQAHGLCFSVKIGVPPPPSLLNMYKELSTDIEGFQTPNHGYLIGWARQGVLLLNACLTVRKNMPNSHKDQGWEQLTTAVIKYLNDHRSGIVFLLWGSYAQKKADFVDKKKHHILKTVHPSPLSASRGWFGCKHFSKCNDILKSMGKAPIDWARLPTK